MRVENVLTRLLAETHHTSVDSLLKQYFALEQHLMERSVSQQSLRAQVAPTAADTEGCHLWAALFHTDEGVRKRLRVATHTEEVNRLLFSKLA